MPEHPSPDEDVDVVEELAADYVVHRADQLAVDVVEEEHAVVFLGAEHRLSVVVVVVVVVEVLVDAEPHRSFVVESDFLKALVVVD